MGVASSVHATSERHLPLTPSPQGRGNLNFLVPKLHLGTKVGAKLSLAEGRSQAQLGNEALKAKS